LSQTLFNFSIEFGIYAASLPTTACICESAPRQTRGGVEPHLSIRLAIHFRTKTKTKTGKKKGTRTKTNEGGAEPHLSIRLAIHFRTNTKHEHNDKCEVVEVENLIFPSSVLKFICAPGHLGTSLKSILLPNKRAKNGLD